MGRLDKRSTVEMSCLATPTSPETVMGSIEQSGISFRKHKISRMKKLKTPLWLTGQLGLVIDIFPSIPYELSNSSVDLTALVLAFVATFVASLVSWCSWLSRQSNTLKVSGSSPGEIRSIPFGSPRCFAVLPFMPSFFHSPLFNLLAPFFGSLVHNVTVYRHFVRLINDDILYSFLRSC
ncbi:hypothetical protein F4782DRAFT_229964 [Xylaria castorea]|nr:hypothetical protein F4782DRAFT_229964 [Xylaria castorea]